MEFESEGIKYEGELEFDKGGNLFVLKAKNFEFTFSAGDSEIQKTNLLISLIKNFKIKYK